MKQSQIIALIVAICLIVTGSLISSAAMASLGFDFTKLSTVKLQTNTYTVSEAFSDISINTEIANVQFAVSQDGSCQVVCKDTEALQHVVSVEDGTLMIRTEDNRQWYDYIGIFLGNQSVTVYLPEKDYAELSVDTATGNVKIPGDVSFEQAYVETATGNVQWQATVVQGLELNTHTGNISIKGVMCGTLAVDTDTGNVTMANTLASGKLTVKTATGNVNFDKVDAADIWVKTSTGNVKGTLLSDKVFETKTATGNITTPDGQTIEPKGTCTVETQTGNIRLKVDPAT